MYLIITDAYVVRIAVGTITFGAFAPENLSVAAEPTARLHIHPRRPLH